MRSAFDKFISWTGLLMAVVLLVAGGLLWWAHSFIGDQVNEQLTMQGITMPEGDALASLPKADAEALKPYAGSTLDEPPWIHRRAGCLTTSGSGVVVLACR